jgi:hypothetical protein
MKAYSSFILPHNTCLLLLKISPEQPVLAALKGLCCQNRVSDAFRAKPQIVNN